MKLKIVLILSLMLSLLLSSCVLLAGDDDGAVYYTSSTPSGTYYSDGTYVEVYPKTPSQWLTHDATSVYVSLGANSSTGYEWVSSIDGNSIYLDSQSYSSSDYYSSGLVGTPGLWNAVFETSGYDGTSYVTLSYMRPWDSSSVAESHSFSVTAYYGTVSDVTILY